MQVGCPHRLDEQTTCDGLVEVEVTEDSDGDGVYATFVLRAVADDRCSEGHELTDEQRAVCEEKACDAYYDRDY